MEMEQHVTCPGLQYSDNTQLTTDEFGVLSKFLNGVRPTSHEETVEEFLIFTGECSKCSGYSYGEEKIACWE